MTVFQRMQNNLFLRFLVLACAFSVIFSSCRKDLTSMIGSDLQPENEFIGAHFNSWDASLRLVAYTIEDLPGITSGGNFFALGSFKDATFGTISVDLISQIDEMFRWDTVPNPADIVGIDSVVMILIYADVYPFQEVGEEVHPFTVSIGELAEPQLIDAWTLDRTYFSNDYRAQIGGGGTIVSGLEVRPNLRDSINIYATVRNHNDTEDSIIRNHDDTGDSIRERRHVPTLRIPIYTANNPNIMGRDFGERLLETSARLLPQSQSIDSGASFLSEIPGLYIRTHPELVEGRGNIVTFDFTGNIIVPQIQVHYRYIRRRDNAPDTVVSRVKLYSIDFWNSMTYNFINIDRSTASSPDLRDQLVDSTLGQNMVFLQSFFGSLVRVEMPDIRDFANNLAFDSVGNPMRMVINQASLVLTPSSNGRFTPAASFGIGVWTDTTIQDTVMHINQPPIDRDLRIHQNIRDHSLAVGGGHDTRGGRNEYRIFLTRHIQNLLLDPDAENASLTIFPNNRHLFPNITSIYGPGLPLDDNRRMRLEIVYTLIPK
ncbi:MAG: DUF4270 domain-containing protein [Bacteroidales bacterium]|nr:DUF4270 domain-containing protein [Bacteroidales bacterium]